MKQLLALVLTLLAIHTGTAFSQSSGYTISGRAVANSHPAEAITINLINALDSSLVKAEITDKEGKFVFINIADGRYHLVASAMGYQTLKTEAIILSGTDIEVKDLELITTSKRLNDVVVTARKPYIEMKADKMVVNVDASPTNAGNTALEVLEKAPGVTVDRDGNISLKGKQGVQVMIDGRPSYMSGTDLANYLRGMSASQLEQVEIMTNPPAKYDAAGNSGIINIKTKKSKTIGWNGSVNGSYGQGVYPKANTGFNLNYRNRKFNLFGSGNYAYRAGFQEFSVNRYVYEANSSDLAFSFKQKTFMPDTRKSMNGKVGIDYDFSKKTFASFTVDAFNVKMKYDARSENQILSKSGALQTINYGRTHMTPNVSKLTSNINVTHKLDTAGTELVFNADYIRYNDKHSQQFYNSFFDHTGTALSKPDSIKGYLPTGFHVYAAKIDFAKPFANKSKLEIGAKASYVISDNDIRFDSTINGILVPDVKRSNHFIYKENVYAGYITYNTPITKKLSVQAGLRYEVTDGRGKSVTRNTSFNNRYGQVFPTVYFSYAASDHNNFNLNYGRRITRPQYRDLNPFIFIIDQYTSQQGNPYLQPQFSHNIELSHSYKNTVTSTLHYTQVNDVINEIIEPTAGTQEVALIKKNISQLKQFGLAVNVYKPVNKWLTVISNNAVFHNNYSGKVGSSDVDVSAFSANFYAALQFKLQKGWEAEINGWFNTRSIEGTALNNSMGMFSVGASKSLWENKGKIGLSINDPFALLKYSGTTKLASIDATINSRWDNRTITLSFSYRFGKMFNTKKRSAGSATEEQSRIGN